MNKNSKIVVLGGSGLIGSKLISLLREKGCEAVSASRREGVNLLTGEGLAQAFAGAQVVVDVTNSPSFEDQAVMHYFQTAGHHIVEAERAAGVKHHIALSVVGTERMQVSGYFRAKLVQEEMIKASGIPFTIVRATQFFEFVEAIIQAAVTPEGIRLPSATLQPIAADDVATALALVVEEHPVNGIVEIAGPAKIPLDELARQFLQARQDPRLVTTDPQASYFGMPINDQSLTPTGEARIGGTSFGEWLR